MSGLLLKVLCSEYLESDCKLYLSLSASARSTLCQLHAARVQGMLLKLVRFVTQLDVDVFFTYQSVVVCFLTTLLWHYVSVFGGLHHYLFLIRCNNGLIVFWDIWLHTQECLLSILLLRYHLKLHLLPKRIDIIQLFRLPAMRALFIIYLFQ